MFKCIIILIALGVSVFARTAGTSQNAIKGETPRSEESNFYFGDLRYVFKVYQECAATDLTSCLKLKLIAAIDRASRAYTEIPLFNGVMFVKDAEPTEETSSDVKLESDIESSLPRALEERDNALNDLISNRISSFLETHTLKVKLPTITELQRSFNDVEGRGKKKKSSGFLLLPLILGGTLVPLALGALALLAGKALIVSKLALVLAAIVGLKKLFSGYGSAHDAGHVEVVSAGHGSGWGRSYSKEESQNLAYQAYTSKIR